MEIRLVTAFKSRLSLPFLQPLILLLCMFVMDSSVAEIDFEFLPFIRVFKDGRIERLIDNEFVPSSLDPQTGVSSKDVLVAPQSNLSARLYLPPNLSTAHHKLPLVIYFHGGGFCVSSPFSPRYHDYLNSLVLKANVVAVSVDYRLAPEHPIPIAYEDSWNALKWIASHCEGAGPEVWLNEFADFNSVFLVGESAGANIAHKMAMLAGKNKVGFGAKILGIALVHPYFWGSQPIGSEAVDLNRKALVDRIWPLACRALLDNDDPLINPMAPEAPTLSNLGCSRVLVCVAEKDILKDRGCFYYETLMKCGWKGVVEIMETEGDDHIFHLFNTVCENAKDLMTHLVVFLNGESPPPS